MPIWPSTILAFSKLYHAASAIIDAFKHLRNWTDELACQLSDEMIEARQAIIVDSTKMPICTFARAPRVKICQEQSDMLPAYGYSASTKTRYFGYKLHLACSEQGVVVNYFLTPANEADVRNVKELTSCLPGPRLALADKGYISKAIQLDLFENQQVKLVTPLRDNQHDFSAFGPEDGAKRMRIETLFSQLIDQFALRIHYAKTYLGFVTRLTIKIAALTVLQHANFLEGVPIGHLKNAWCL